MREAIAGQNNPAYSHGHTAGGKFSPTYQTWTTMWTRCTNPKRASWKDYGGRGITVCEEWKSFENFLADMGERPQGYTLDRRDNDSGYYPENCRWATADEQRGNTRATIWVEIDGVRKRLTEWAAELNISLNTVRARVGRQGMSYAQALTKPTRKPDGTLASGFSRGDPRNPKAKRSEGES